VLFQIPVDWVYLLSCEPSRKMFGWRTVRQVLLFVSAYKLIGRWINSRSPISWSICMHETIAYRRPVTIMQTWNMVHSYWGQLDQYTSKKLDCSITEDQIST
jgi:hypothetical protein